ncbi:MAG: ATP-binding protein [Bacteroidales bacterium]|nr:ATP-binding protein [Bacteroidales bacterium]
MGLPILILGYSGSGKSASMRNFGADEIALVNVNGKPLPFRTQFSQTLCSDRYPDIDRFLHSVTAKIIVIDDCQYLMANEFMRRANERSYDKFTEIGQSFWSLVRSVSTLPSDVTVYFLSHIDTDENGRQKIKTIGKLLDEKITVEGMFTVVLKTVMQDGHYFFATQTDGRDTCKSPMGLFPAMYIDNDLKMVDISIREYYSVLPDISCEVCGNPIQSVRNKTAAEIADGTLKAYGRKLCWNCACSAMKQKKEEANAGTS